jgi:hypothetical protein
MHPFNLIIHHVLEQISRDYSIAIKYESYLIPLVSRPLKGISSGQSPRGAKGASKNDKSSTLPLKVPTNPITTPYPNALPISKMKRSDLITELSHYQLPTEGTVSEMKLLLKEHRIKPIKKKRKKQPKRRDYVPPLHEHSPTDQLVIGCAFCDSHGNSLASSFSTGTVF